MPTTNEICTRDGYYTCSRCGERQMVLHDDEFPVCRVIGQGVGMSASRG